jgi:hypothetical protein
MCFKSAPGLSRRFYWSEVDAMVINLILRWKSFLCGPLCLPCVLRGEKMQKKPRRTRRRAHGHKGLFVDITLFRNFEFSFYHYHVFLPLQNDEPMSKVKVGLVQMSCTANKEENIQKAISKVKEAAAKGAQVICLQELFTSLYFCDVEDYENFKLAEPIPGPSTETLSKVAAESGCSHNCFII